MTKKALIRSALIFLVSFLFINCEKDDSNNINVAVTENLDYKTTSTTKIVTAKEVPGVANLFSTAKEQANIQNSYVNSSIYELTKPNGEKTYSALVYLGETTANNFYNIVVNKRPDGSFGTPAILEYQTSLAKDIIDSKNYRNSNWQMSRFRINSSSQKKSTFDKSSPCSDSGVFIPAGGIGLNTSHLSGFDFSNNIFDSDNNNYVPVPTGGTFSGWVQVCSETIRTSTYRCNGSQAGTPHGSDTCGDPTTNYGGSGENLVVEESCLSIYVTVREATRPIDDLPDVEVTLGSSLFFSNCVLQRVRDGIETDTDNLTVLGTELLEALINELDETIDYCSEQASTPTLPFKSGVKQNKTSTTSDCPDPIDVNVVIPSETWELFEVLNIYNPFSTNIFTEGQKQWVLDYKNSSEVSDMLSFIQANGDTEENRDLVKDIIQSDIDGRLVSDFPFLKYPPNSGYETAYPKLTEYLENQFSKVSNIPNIVNTIKLITGLSESQIKEDLTWGKGPTIHITQLDNYATTTSSKTAGLFSPSEPDVVHLDIDYVNELENDLTDQSQEDAFLFFLGTTLLHEYVHYGDNIDGTQFREGTEEGKLFEFVVYGQDVNSTNAAFILEDKQ